MKSFVVPCEELQTTWWPFLLTNVIMIHSDLKNGVVLYEVMSVKLPSSDWYYNYLKYMFTFRCIGSYSNFHVMNNCNRLHWTFS